MCIRDSGYTVIVQGHKAHVCAVTFNNLVNLVVIGIFHRVAAFPPEKLHRKSQQIFRAGADDDLLRRAVDPTVLVHIVRDGLSQGVIPPGIYGPQQIAVAVVEDFP